MESKKEIYDLIPEQFYPNTLFVRSGRPPEDIYLKIEKAGLNFPLIGKPDIGMRGRAVKILHDRKELDEYISNSKVDFLIQEFITYEMEAGIFYYRLPNEKKGTVSGIVLKEFLSVQGDGISTILELISKEKRYILQNNAIKKEHPGCLNNVLSKGVKKVLVPYGNHSRGTKFVDASDLINEKLTSSINQICKQIKGFYYGRLDIRFSSWEELSEGKNFSIIELNGAGSEPTHIYDPRHSIFFAWKEIIRHANILYRISKQNRKTIPYIDFHSGIKMLYENSRHLKLLSSDKQRA